MVDKRKNKRFVRYAEGAEMYSMGITKFQELAKEAHACYKVNQLVLVNLDILDEYLETFPCGPFFLDIFFGRRYTQFIKLYNNC